MHDEYLRDRARRALGTGPTGHIYTVWPSLLQAPAAPSLRARPSLDLGRRSLTTLPRMATDAAGNFYIASGPKISPGSIRILNSAAIRNVAPTALLAGADITIDPTVGQLFLAVRALVTVSRQISSAPDLFVAPSNLTLTDKLQK
jgi:hypothetical protein